MQIVSYVIAFFIAIMLLVSLHEFGHFVVAKMLGIKVLRFSIGFGKPLWRWQSKAGTEYVIAMLPLGGYVKMLDENEAEVPTAELRRAFNRQPVLARAAVVIAGPLMNLLFAAFAFWIVFSIGVEQIKPIVGKVLPDSIAAKAGVQTNIQLIQVDKHAIQNWQDVTIAVISRLGDSGIMEITAKKLDTKGVIKYHLSLRQWRLDPLKPDPLEGLGIKPYSPVIPPVIGAVKENGPAAKSGLQVGDKIVSYDKVPVNNWFKFVEYIQLHPKQVIELQVMRNGQLLLLPVKIEANFVMPFKRIGYLGILPEKIEWPADMKHQLNYSLLAAWKPAWQETWQLLCFNFVMLGKLITGKISLQSLGGPIMIMQSANAAFVQGVTIYLTFLAFLSVMLAFVNMLPIPTLDGGHFIYLIIEAITGKSVSLNVQHLTYRLGFIILIMLIISATINDIMRLF